MFLYTAIYQRFTILLSEIELQLVKAAAAISPYLLFNTQCHCSLSALNH